MALMHDLSQTDKFHHLASLVSKILRNCTLCPWVFFSTEMPWERISVPLQFQKEVWCLNLFI